MKMKKLLALLLTLVMVVGLLPTMALAEDEKINITLNGITGENVTVSTLARTVRTTADARVPNDFVDTVYTVTVDTDTVQVCNTSGVALTRNDYYASYLDRSTRIIIQVRANKILSSFQTVDKNTLIRQGFLADDLAQDTDDYFYKFYYIHFDFEKNNAGGSKFGMLVQLPKVKPNRTALIAALDEANALKEADYYTSGDRFNGNPSDYIQSGSLWDNMKTARTEANRVYNLGNDAEQTAINKASDDLVAAVAKLIPATQLNATDLYEAVKRSNISAANYTSGTYKAFDMARTAAQNYLNALFDAETGPALNIAANQSVANAYATALDTARKNLFPTSLMDQAQRCASTIEKLDRVFGNLKEADYEETSWSAYVQARAAATEHVGNYPADENLTRPQYNDYVTKTRAYWTAAYALRTKATPTVTLHFSDDLGMRYPEYAMRASYQETVTMAEGTYTLQQLLTQAGLSTLDHLGYSYKCDNAGKIWDDWLVYINGVLVRDPIWDTEIDTDQTIALNTWDSNINWSTVCVRNGDTVTLARVEAALVSTYQGGSATPFALKIPYVGKLSLKLNKTTAAEGEAISAAVTRTDSYLLTYSGRSRNSTSARLAVYGPQNENGSWPAAPTVMDSGTELTLFQAGTYLVAAFEPGEQDITNHVYPNLTVGAAPVTVTITPLSEDALKAKKAEFGGALDALLTAVKDYDYTEADWGRLPGIIEAGKANIEAADSIKGIQNAYDVAAGAFAAVNKIDHDAVIALFARYLDYLPSAAQIKEGLFTKAHIRRMGWAKDLYDSFSDYQLSLLTKEQVDHYNALIAAYGADGSALPVPTVSYDVTVYTDNSTVVDCKNEWVSQIQGRISGVNYLEDMSEVEAYDENPTASAIQKEFFDQRTPTYTVSARYNEYHDFYTMPDAIKITFPIAKQHYDLFQGVEIVGAEADSIEIKDVQRGSFHDGALHEYGYYEYTIYVVNPYHAFSVHIKAAEGDDAALAQAKTAACKELTDLRDSKNRSSYTTENWNALITACNTGLNNIDAATTADDVTTAKENALAIMAAVPTKTENSNAVYGWGEGSAFDAGKKVGTVTVIAENTSYAGADFPGGGKTGAIFSEESYEIGENDSMMTVILRALYDNGYGWEGTGGSGFGITYLAQIFNDNNHDGACDAGGKKMGEFSYDFPGSGWMGALNDFMVNEGLNQFRVSNGLLGDGDEIKLMFTTNLGEDLGGTWGNSDTTLKKLEVSVGTLVPEFAGGTAGGSYDFTLVIPGSSANVTVTPHAANINYMVKTFLNEKVTTDDQGNSYYRRREAIPVRGGDIIYIGCGEKAWPSMNKQGAEARGYTGTWYALHVVSKDDGATVATLIDQLGAVTYSNYESKQTAVAAARAAYDNLSAAAKGQVTNLAKLEAAEAKIAGYKKIDNVKGLLAALPKEEGLSDAAILALQDDIEAADAAYKKLTKEQQDYITVGDAANYNDLQKRLEALKPDTTAQFIVGGSGGEKKDKKDEEGNAIAAASVTVAPEVVDGAATAEVSAEDVTAALLEAGKDAAVLTVKVETEGAGSVAAGLPADAVKAAADAGVGLNVETENGTVKVDAGTLAEAAKGGKAVAVTVTENADGTTTVGVTADGKAVEADVKIELEAKDGQMLVVVGPDGTETPVILSATEDGTVYAKVPAGSTVKVVDAEGKDFGDVKAGDWFAEAVEFVSSHGIFQGTGDGTFAPGTTMNRAMLAMVLYRIDGAAGGGSSTFGDVDPGAWYADAVAWAADAGIVNGRGEGFAPDAPVTREEIATMLYRFVKHLGVDVSGASADLAKFPDGGDISPWAGEAMQWAVSVGLFRGGSGGALNPGGEATRAEVATLVERLVTLLVK